MRRQSMASISNANCAGVSTTPPSTSGGQTKRLRSKLGEQATPGPIPMQRLQVIAALAAEKEDMPAVRLDREQRADQRRQPIEAEPHADGFARQIDLCSWC